MDELWSGKAKIPTSLPTLFFFREAVAMAKAFILNCGPTGFWTAFIQGVVFSSGDDPVLYLNNPEGHDKQSRRDMLDQLSKFNSEAFNNFGDPEINTRIKQYEMSYRMQSAVPELTDLSKESDNTIKMYGPDCLVPGTYAANCLLARKLSESGVRFVQLYHQGWDTHGNLVNDMRMQAEDVDRASAGLIKDLKQRGLLDETLVIWGGEIWTHQLLSGKD